MEKRKILALGLALFMGMALLAPSVSHSVQTAEGFVQSWQLLGQFQRPGGANPGEPEMVRDYMTDGVTTELAFVPEPGKTINTDFNASAASTGYTAGTRGFTIPTVILYQAPGTGVDYSAVYGDQNDIMAYAWTYANNKTGAPFPCYMGVASDDAIQVLVNNAQVHINNIARGWGGNTEVQDVFPITLAPGANVVMIKVFEGGGGFGLRMRLQTTNTTGDGRTAADSVGESQVSFSALNPTLAQPPNALRQFAGNYIPGSTPGTTVTITVTAQDAGAITLTEVVPTGLTPAIASATNGTPTIAGQNVTWTATLAANETAVLTYFLQAPLSTCGTNFLFSASTLQFATYTLSVGGAATIGMGGGLWQDSPLPWAQSETIGTADIGSAEWFACNDTYKVVADGADIWGTADQFHFLYMLIRGNFVIAATVEVLPPPTNEWAKAGLMVRNNNTPGSPQVIVAVSNTGPGDPAVGTNDLTFQWRDAQDTDAAWIDDPTGKFTNNGPARLTMARAGTNVVVAYDNLEGSVNPNWSSHDAPNISTTDPVLVGLAFTSHAAGVFGTAVFSQVVLAPGANVVAPAVKTITRKIQETSFTTTPIHVEIGVTVKTAAVTLAVAERIPTGWTAASISNGGTFNAGTSTINWTLAPFNADTTLTYQATPNAGASALAAFSGQSTDANNYVVQIAGENTLIKQGALVFQDGVYPDATYAGTADSFIIMYPNVNPGDRNSGRHTFLEEGDWDGVQTAGGGFGDNKLIVIAFNIRNAGIRPGSTVNSAAMRLRYDHQRRGGITTIDHDTYAHLLLKPWGEGAGTGDDGPVAAAGEVSWMSARAGTEDWATSGARRIGLDIAPPVEFQAKSKEQYGAGAAEWVEYDMTKFVQFWLDNPQQNFGVKVSQDDLGSGTSTGYVQGAYQFVSSDNAATQFRPMLVVDYTESIAPLSVRSWHLYDK